MPTAHSSPLVTESSLQKAGSKVWIHSQERFGPALFAFVTQIQYSLNMRWICRSSFVLVSASISRMRAFCTFRLSPTTKLY